jgi:Ca2+-transporting ATPase
MAEAGSTPGLSGAEAALRLAAEGPNALPSADTRGMAAIALQVAREPMFLLLVGGAAIYLFLGDLREALVLGVSVFVVMAITVVQERKAERALEALRDLSSPRALVVRDGAPVRIAGAGVVRGDLLLVAEGDRVPADAKLHEGAGVLMDESLLTGESLAVAKSAAAPGRESVLYSGTLVVRGQGRAEVTATGSRSELGRIGVSLAALETGKTTLERETARIVRLVAGFALAFCTLVALVHFATRGEWAGAVLAGLTLAMAILPEEFPVVLTVFLALGAWRISQHGVLTRRMPAVEMLGAATVLCVDKTGTLTENRMAVVDLYAGGWSSTEAPGERGIRLLEAAALASETDALDPMDRAIVEAAARAAPEADRLRAQWRLERDYPFSDSFLAMCHGWRSPTGEARVVVKGAPETVLSLCGLDEAQKQAALREASGAAGRGLRLLAVAEAPWREAGWAESPRQYRFAWLGFVAITDPLRASVPEAVALCRRAGIRVVMITGDYPGTALAIARAAGIDTAAGAITGEQLARMDEADLAQRVRGVSVFARILPDQKLRLVAAYRAAGEVVAMTGDGVNDAPALKAADIGIAMGRRGTDVAREASALVLVEDDFGSIVRTVQLGRRIYENIRNAMRYIISVHVPVAGMSFIPLLAGWPVVIHPVHVLFLEFVIDPACSVVFEAEPSDEGAMDRPPRPPREPLFNAHMLAISLLLGASALAAVCLVYWWAVASGRTDGEARAIGFAAIVFANLALIQANRSRDRLLHQTLGRRNPALWWVVGGALAALALAIYVPPIAGIFRFEPVAALDLAVAAAAGAAGVLWYELRKLARRRATMPA